MEGELRSQLETAGALGPHHHVMSLGRAPHPAFGGWTALVGFALGALGLAWWRCRYAAPATRSSQE
jgi:hypothetical protein